MPGPAQRQRISSISGDPIELGFMARVFVQATLPHKSTDALVHTRRNGRLTLKITADKDFGLPYGRYPWLLLAWMLREGCRTKSRRLELENSPSSFMAHLGLTPTGAKALQSVRPDEGTQSMSMRRFIQNNFRHFNAATVADATEGYIQQLASGGEMLMTLAGAMSTAELGVSLARMIRQQKVHAICCTGANLEEDLFNLVAHDHYRRLPGWRNLTADDEKELEKQGLNRVTDTCIPEEQAIRAIERPLLGLWKRAEAGGERRFPHEFLYELIESDTLAGSYQIDPADSWLVAACEADLPIFVPGWEDSTLGNIFAARLLDGTLARHDLIRGGVEYMTELVQWYVRRTMGREIQEIAATPQASGKDEAVAARAVRPDAAKRTIGFFQIGGGIAGDFPICAVPLIHQDLEKPCPYWGYFCQISDSTTSYGSYSGAFPTEKITWGKLDVDTPRYLIESDATIVAPLMFTAILEA